MSDQGWAPTTPSAGRALELPDVPSRPVLDALRRRRALRGELWQGIYVAAGLGLGLVLPEMTAGPTVQSSAVRQLLFGVAGGLISFIALVFSLLFLVVQFSNSTISPRLTLFRDDPLVWHSFGFFAGLFLFCSTAGMRVGSGSATTSPAVAVVAVLMVLVALAMSRALQLRALKLLQLNTTMEEVRRRGEDLLARLYTRPATDVMPVVDEVHLPGPATDVVWSGATTTLQHVDLRALLRSMRRADGVIRMQVMIGAELRRGATVATIHAPAAVPTERVVGTFTTGTDRTFAQDPLLAFRLLSDIGDRALSAAVNDPATAEQAVTCLYDLLSIDVDRQLSLGPIVDEEGTPRILLCLPSWEDFVAAAVDEIAHYAAIAPTVHRRLTRLLADVDARAPAAHRDALSRRLEALDSPADTSLGPVNHHQEAPS